MWKYTLELIKSQKKTIWIVCIAFSIIISLVLTISHFQNIETSDTKSAIVIISIFTVIPIAVALVATWSIEHKAKKIWEYVNKDFSLKENEFTEFKYTLKDCYKSRKILNEILDLPRFKLEKYDFWNSPVTSLMIIHNIYNADCTMTWLLMRVITSMGGKFYLFLDDKKRIFFYVKDNSGNELYEKQIKDLSILKEETNIEDYIW